MFKILSKNLSTNILLIILPLTCATYICGRVSDPDLWFHITIGRWILAHFEIPDIDYWSRFSYGSFSLAYSWLFDITAAWIDLNFAQYGLWLVQYILALFLIWSLCKVYSLVTNSNTIGIILGSFTSLALHSHFALRPQTIIWIIFIWLIYFSDRLTDQNNKYCRVSLVSILALLCIWANLHISTIIGVITVLVWSLTKLKASKALITTLLALLATMATPFMGKEWITFFSKISHPFKFNSIVEFNSISNINLVVLSSAALLIILVYLTYLAPRILHPLIHLYWLGLMVCGYSVVKFLPFSAILFAFLVAKYIASSDKNIKLNLLFSKIEEELLKIRVTWPKKFFIIVLLAILVLNMTHILKSPVAFANFPVREFDMLVEESMPLPVLTNFELGGYMMYRMSDQQGQIDNPDARVPIDGRTNLIPFTIWQMYEKSITGESGWNELIEHIKPRTIIWFSDSLFVNRLIESNNWCQISNDNYNLNSKFSVLTNREWLSKKQTSSDSFVWENSRCGLFKDTKQTD